ncbi:MAG: DUF2283 domain-containing protein [Gemmatimonadaceae bacterium]
MTYDPDVDALYFELRALRSQRRTQREIAEGVILELGPSRELAGLEILGASRFGTPRALARFGRPSPGMRLSEAAAFCGIKAASLRNQILNGRLKASKVGRDWLVDVNDLEAYLDGRSARGRRAATEKPRRRARRTAA